MPRLGYDAGVPPTPPRPPVAQVRCSPGDPLDPVVIERWLDRLYLAVEGATLRREERKKASELAGLLAEVARAVAGTARARPVLMVDAAAGKGYVGLLAAQLLLAPARRAGRVVVLEREAARVDAGRAAAAALDAGGVQIEHVAGDVGDPRVWPAEPDVVVALHACGPAADAVLDRAVAARARRILLAPCCTGAAVAGAPLADRLAAELGVPAHAEVRRRFVQAVVDAERTLRLEAAGYETTVVAFAPPTVTPHNLLWRARRVGEPRRAEAARERLRRLQGR